MPFVDVLVPVTLDGMDALAGERPGRRIDGRMVLGVPGGEQADAFPLGEAVEVGDLGEARGRRLFKQAVEAGGDAVAGNVEAGLGRGGDRNRLEALDGADQLAPVGEGPGNALARTARRGGELETGGSPDGGDMLILGDLAIAEGGDPDRLHLRPAT